MDLTAKDEMWNIIVEQFKNIHERRLEMTKRLNENSEFQLDFLQAVFTELSEPRSGPPVTKTPKVLRKKGFQRIETIPENDVFQAENTLTSPVRSDKEKKEEEEANGLTDNKSKRKASIKAVNNMKKQQLFMNLTKLRRPSEHEDDDVSIIKKQKRGSQLKRKQSEMNNDESRKNPKHNKATDENFVENTEPATEIKKSKLDQSNEKTAQTKRKSKEFSTSPRLQSSTKLASKSLEGKEERGKTTSAQNSLSANEAEDPSLYEDAIGKPTPIMNSTMKYSPTVPQKILNATVILEPLVMQQRNLNETVVIKKNSTEKTSLKRTWEDSVQENKRTIQTNVTYTCNDLITDDESSPEMKKSKVVLKKQKKSDSLIFSEDEVPNTPVDGRFKEPITSTIKQGIKVTHKSNALFSPYAKESVKKRVEAFEQAVMNSGSKQVDIAAPTRITRTKTRAMAAKENEAEAKSTDKNLTQMYARKSLAKAKKIATLIGKQKKNNEEEFKENKEQLPERINKLLMHDEISAKQTQQLKSTPMTKLRMVPPISASRLQTPLNSASAMNYPKPLSVTRANIVTGMNSFIQPPVKSVNKDNSADKLEEKKRHEEDAIKKRNEALRLQTEEKKRKRKEKELKNKLAREAKEKQELEKRQKTEKEREEKARIAQLMQEKQREEMEKKRQAQLQRTQEKEERRKLEEQQRLQKLQAMEEAERLLAEQRRREQEAEKRKETEARAQQAVAETLKQKKNQLLFNAHLKYKQMNNKQNNSCYKLESEPDDDESDEESKPKYEIPYWAQSHVRKAQLAMQRYIPEEIVYKFFDTRKCTPDLTELFHGIDRKRLQRTSSAIWKTPPRFSMMEID